MSVPFNQFVMEELERRGWSLADLASRCGVEESELAEVVDLKPGRFIRVDQETIDLLAAALYPDDPSAFHTEWARSTGEAG